ncbi:MAG: TolC family protein [Thermodesulfovibrionales bacterium]|jgi:outer membrane protein TolC
MKRIISFALLLICLVPLKGRAEEIIRQDEVLNIERCIEIGLKRQPNIIAAQNTAKVNEFMIGAAKSNYYPQISWTSGYSRLNELTSTFSATGALVTGVVVQTGTFDQFSNSAALSQNIYDFGRTSTQVQIANLNYDSSRFDLHNVSEQIIQSVQQAYYGELQAKRNRDVNIDTVKQYEQHLEQAKGFFEVGTKPRFDVIQAEVNLSNAKLNLIKAENAFKIARVNLNNAMGVPDAPNYGIEDNLSFKSYEITLEDALAKAYANRPDLQSAIAKRKAAEVSVDSAKANYYPFLTGNAAYDWTGERIDQYDHSWSVGAVFTFPVFSGYLTKYQVAEARANLNVLKANEESLRQTVILDVQQAYLNLRAVEEAIPTAELGVRQAQENMDITNGRYAAGVGNPIEITDAEVSLSNAKLSYIQALSDDKVAQANLEKAMGLR